MKHPLMGIGLAPVLFCSVVVAAPSDRGEQADQKTQGTYFELDALTRRAVDRSAAELIVEPNGDLTLALNGSHQHVYMARLGAGGKIETYCASSEKAVRRFLFERPTHQE